MLKFLTKLLSRSWRLFLLVLRHAKFLRKVDFALIVANSTEKLLNLSESQSFFPTRRTDPERVKALVRRLHPVATDKELIRLGPNGDGGYLVPNDLEGITACFSPGVSNVAGFELHCAERGMTVFMADASVDAPPEFHPQFRFTKKFIGSTTEGNFISFEDWVNQSINGSQQELLLQMDIEGYEYETFLSIPKDLQQRFRIIVVEFHFLDYLFSEPLFSIYSRAFEKILSTHRCVHIHPNNIAKSLKVGSLEIPQMAEFTFLKSERISKPVFATQFPHPLDHENSEGTPLRLPKSCYRAS